jgi:surface polysaccharide O-acyltransferase-like enzyme
MTVNASDRHGAVATPIAPSTVGRASRPPERLDGADLVRALAVVGVIAVHAAHWPSTLVTFDDTFWNDVKLAMRFSVPAFVVFSGLLLEYSGASARGRRHFVLRRARRTLLPFVAWAPIYFLSGYFVTNDIEHTPFGAGDWWAGGAGHLYFLVLVPQLYLVYLVWPRRVRVQILLAAGLLVGQTTLNVLRLECVATSRLSQDLLLWHAFEEFPFWIGYFAVGVAAGRLLANFGLPRTKLVTAVALLMLPPSLSLVLETHVGTAGVADFATGTGAFLRPQLAPFVFTICAAGLAVAPALLNHDGLVMRAVRHVSRHALGIYIVQALVLYAPGRVLYGLLQASLPWSAIAFLLLVTLTLLLSLTLTALITRTGLAWTVGAARSRGGAKRPVSVSNVR